MTTSPTALTLARLRADGWPLVEVVERWNPHARRRVDLFGFVDVIAVGLPDHNGLAVQTTSADNVSARLRKIAEHPNLPHVRAAGWEIRVHGWRKRGGRWELHRDIDVS